MLKIKDNVDLKELEKYGFKLKYNENNGKPFSYEKEFIRWNRRSDITIMSEEEIKESYLKLPNVTVGELQDVVDFMEDNDIEYVEFYEKDLKQQIEDLQQKVEQLENIRKEAIKYILKNKLYRFKYDDEELFEITTDKKTKDDLLNILNKGSDKI